MCQLASGVMVRVTVCELPQGTAAGDGVTVPCVCPSGEGIAVAVIVACGKTVTVEECMPVAPERAVPVTV